MGMKRLTYAKAGVDIDRVSKVHRTIDALLSSTLQRRRGIGKALMGVGHYAGMIDLGERVLALHVDGVGTKVLMAQMMGKYDSIGIDCVAMCVNDLICVGAEPIAMIDYLALERPNEEMVSEIMKGLAEGAKQARISIVGGETAVMPDVIKGFEGRGFDLAGLAVGLIEKGKVITGSKLRVDDVVVGVKSSGIHSNGLSLARKALLPRYNLNQFLPKFKMSLGEELLKPTRIYVAPIIEAMKKCEVHALAHITGGAFSKLARLVKKPKLGFLLDDLPKVPPIFQLIQRVGRVSKREMYRTFNMGIGFCVCVPKGEVDGVMKVLKKHRLVAKPIGRIVARPGITVGGVRVD